MQSMQRTDWDQLMFTYTSFYTDSSTTAFKFTKINNYEKVAGLN